MGSIGWSPPDHILIDTNMRCNRCIGRSRQSPRDLCDMNDEYIEWHGPRPQVSAGQTTEFDGVCSPSIILTKFWSTAVEYAWCAVGGWGFGHTTSHSLYHTYCTFDLNLPTPNWGQICRAQTNKFYGCIDYHISLSSGASAKFVAVTDRNKVNFQIHSC